MFYAEHAACLVGDFNTGADVAKTTFSPWGDREQRPLNRRSISTLVMERMQCSNSREFVRQSEKVRHSVSTSLRRGASFEAYDGETVLHRHPGYNET